MAVADFLTLMTTKVIVTAHTGRDAYGAPSYSTSASTYWARVVDASELPPDPSGPGAEVKYQWVAWVASTSKIDEEAKFSWGGSTRRIHRVSAPSTGKGIHHNKVMF
jgi:hypothetical protein